MLNDVYRRVTLRVPRMTATLGAMRTLVCLAACLAAIAVAPSRARADTFLDLQGGISIPVGDSDWTDLADSSPKLGLRIGAIPHEIGAFVAADWTPVNTDQQGWSGPLTSADISAHRFRVMGGVMFHHPLSNTIAVTGHGAIGADIAHANISVDVLGTHTETSDTNTGLGFAFGGGVWFRAGSLEVGGELQLPVAFHHDDNKNDSIPYDYTSVDLELVGGVRFLSH